MCTAKPSSGRIKQRNLDWEQQKPELEGCTFFDDQKAVDDKAIFNTLLDTLEEELLTNQRTQEHESVYQNSFSCWHLSIFRISSKAMSDQKLYKTMTMHELLDELDIIECFGYPGNRVHFGEITKKQKSLYAALGFEDLSLV